MSAVALRGMSAVALYTDPMPPFLPGEYRLMFADAAWSRAEYFALRREVFCAEQGIFDGDDRDGVDEVGTAIVAASCVLGSPYRVVGAVRIHEAQARLWWGSRLAVRPELRRVGALGAGLIRMAVGTARARGCERFLAHVQAQNVAMFEALRWRVLERLELHGRPHALMAAELAAYPARGEDEARVLRPLGARR